MVNDWILPIIRMERCNGCGACVTACPTQAVEMRAGEDGTEARPVIVRPEACVYCGDCEEMCPEGAIALEYEIAVLADKGKGDETTDRHASTKNCATAAARA